MNFLSQALEQTGFFCFLFRGSSCLNTAMRHRASKNMALTFVFCACFLSPANADTGNSLREWWTSCLKEYFRHTAYKDYYLKELEKINRSNLDSISPSQLAASYYPVCKMFTEKGEFLAEALFARQMFNETGQRAAGVNDFLVMAKYANSAGLSYTELDFYNEARYMYDKGENIARKYGFKKVLAQIYTNRAQLHYKAGEYAEAQKMLAGVEKLRGADGVLYNNMALVYYKQKELRKAVSCFDNALSCATGDNELKMRIYADKGDVLIDMAEYDEAEKCLVKAEQLQNDGRLAVSELMIQLSFVRLLIAKGRKSEATGKLVYIEKHLMPGQSDVIKGKYLKELAGMYIKLKDYTRASECMKESSVLTDSLNYANQRRQLSQLMKWYDIAQLRNDNTLLKNENELANIKIRNWTIMVAATVLIVVLLSVLVIISIRKRRNERIQNAVIREQEQKLHLLRQKEFEMEKNKMENEIGKKSRELALFSIDLSSIDNLHKDIGAELAALAEDAVDEDIRKRINATSLKLRRQTACNLSEGFKKYFSEVSPLFSSRLKEAHPNLTPNDQRLCAYIYMGLTSKEISQITFREVESVEKSRNRLRKKIGLDSSVPIREYLSSVVDGGRQ